jgi:hypothetical protein
MLKDAQGCAAMFMDVSIVPLIPDAFGNFPGHIIYIIGVLALEIPKPTAPPIARQDCLFSFFR